MKIVKRSGTEVLFDRSKIVRAIQKANDEVGLHERLPMSRIEAIAGDIEAACGRLEHTPSVEDVQDMVERNLMDSNAFVLMKTYIQYRYLHNLERANYKELINAVSEKLTASNVQNQNANVDEHSFGGRVGEASSVVTRHYALEYLLSPMAKANHLNNEIYIHDLDSYAVGNHNCLSIPFDDLLANGFNTRQTDVRPAQSISTAFQLVAVLFQLQSLQQFGGASATHLDWTMVPYVRKSFYKHYKDGLKYVEQVDVSVDPPTPAEELSIDSPWYKEYAKAARYAMDITMRETYQAVEGMYHNLNTLQSRSGNQLPFTSVNYGTCTLPEGRLVTKALLDTCIKGVGKLHKTSIFPCGIFQCMNGVNRKPGDPNYDLFKLALRSTAQRLYPNYANVDWSGNAGYDRNDPKTYFSTINKTVA